MTQPSPLMPVADARQKILFRFSPLSGESVMLDEALGRVLAEDLTARITQPPFDASAMDGYALRAADVTACPVELTVTGEAAAGSEGAKIVGRGEAIRIFTGGVMPRGADTIVIQENVTRLEGDRIRIENSALAGRHIRPRGQDFKEGQMLLAAGTLMGPRQIGLAAAANCADVTLRRRPRIGILSTGDEIKPAGSILGPGQIVNSNGPALAALITANGGIPVDLGIAADTPESLRAAVDSATNLDLLITIGGASVGAHDLVQRTLSDMGLKIDFWRIAMRPGKPLMCGDFNGTPMIGLPGNPVAVMVCALIFVIPALRRMAGLTPEIIPPERVRLGTALPANDDRQDYLRAKLVRNAAGQLEATTMPSQDSSMLHLLAHSDCLILRPPHAPAAKPGDDIEIVPLGPRPIFI